jgi:hypothetical protein
MLFRRGRFAMIACYMGDNLDFNWRKTAKLTVKNNILTMFVMRRDGNKGPDVMQKGGTFEELPIRCFKLVKRLQTVKQLQGETGNML